MYQAFDDCRTHPDLSQQENCGNKVCGEIKSDADGSLVKKQADILENECQFQAANHLKTIAQERTTQEQRIKRDAERAVKRKAKESEYLTKKEERKAERDAKRATRDQERNNKMAMMLEMQAKMMTCQSLGNQTEMIACIQKVQTELRSN